MNLVRIPENTRPKTIPKINPLTVMETAVDLRCCGARSAVRGLRIWGVTCGFRESRELRDSRWIGVDIQ